MTFIFNSVLCCVSTIILFTYVIDRSLIINWKQMNSYYILYITQTQPTVEGATLLY